jgi:hypothetical protein
MRGGFATWHSQITRTFQPAFLSREMLSLSRRALPLIFFLQKLALLCGRRLPFGQRA